MSVPPPHSAAQAAPTATLAFQRASQAGETGWSVVSLDELPPAVAAVFVTNDPSPSKRATKRKPSVKGSGSRPPKAARNGAPSAKSMAAKLIEGVDASKMSPDAKLLMEAVLTALAPACVRLDVVANEGSELKGEVKTLARVTDTHGELCQRVASGVAVINKTIANNIVDLTSSDDRPAVSKSAATTMQNAIKNDKKMAVSRRHFKQSYKKNMASTNVSAGFFKGSADTMEFLIECVMESQKMSEEQAVTYLLAVLPLPNQSKDGAPEYRVIRLILRSANHLTQEIRKVVIPAFLDAVGASVSFKKVKSSGKKCAVSGPVKKKGGTRTADSGRKAAGKASSRAKSVTDGGSAVGAKRAKAHENADGKAHQAAPIMSRAIALEWLDHLAYAKSDKGWKGIRAGVEALVGFLHATHRIVEPVNIGQERYILCPLVYPVLVAAIVRAHIEQVAGERPLRRSGTG